MTTGPPALHSLASPPTPTSAHTALPLVSAASPARHEAPPPGPTYLPDLLLGVCRPPRGRPSHHPRTLVNGASSEPFYNFTTLSPFTQAALFLHSFVYEGGGGPAWARGPWFADLMLYISFLKNFLLIDFRERGEREKHR